MSASKNSIDDTLKELLDSIRRIEKEVGHMTTMINTLPSVSQPGIADPDSATALLNENDTQVPPENDHFHTTNTITPQYNPQINALINVLDPEGHYQKPSSLPKGTLPTNPYWKDLLPRNVDRAKANQLHQIDYERIGVITRKYILFLGGLVDDAKNKCDDNKRSDRKDVADLTNRLEIADGECGIGKDMEQRERLIKEMEADVAERAEEVNQQAEFNRKREEELNVKEETLGVIEASIQAQLDNQERKQSSDYLDATQKSNKVDYSTPWPENDTIQNERGEGRSALGRNLRRPSWDTYRGGQIDLDEGYSPTYPSPFIGDGTDGYTIGHKERQRPTKDFAADFDKKTAIKRREMQRMIMKHGYGNTGLEQKVTGKNGTPTLETDPAFSNFRNSEELGDTKANARDQAYGQGETHDTVAMGEGRDVLLDTEQIEGAGDGRESEKAALE